MISLNPPASTRLRDLTGLSLSLSLGQYQSTLLYWGDVLPGTWRTPWHTHPFVEVCYAFAGRGTFRIHDEEHLVQAGDMFVARSGEVHQIVSGGDDALGIYFWAFTLERMPPSDRHGDAIDDLLEAFLASSLAIRPSAPPVALTLDLLVAEMGRHEAGYTQAIEGLATKLLIDSCRTVTDVLVARAPISRGRNVADSIVQTIVRYLWDNYGRTITLRDIAAHVHLSARHTSRLFRRATGSSPMEYLTCLRLHFAQQRLLSGGSSIKEVADQCGYPDVQYFSTIFRRHTGVPPGRFRDQGGTHLLDPELPQPTRA